MNAMKLFYGDKPKDLTASARNDLVRHFLSEFEQGGQVHWGDFEECIREKLAILDWDLQEDLPSFDKGFAWCNSRSGMAKA